MNALMISDLHLTEVSAESYRWEIFDTVRDFIKKNSIPNLYIMGDLMDRKDRHPAELVNHLINELVKCSWLVRVTILKGNHDYLKPESPFLDFLEHFENISWINQPTEDLYQDVKRQKEQNMLWLPHSRNPEIEWADLNYKDLDYVFMHQSVIGCKVSNMFEMNHGLNLNWLTSRTNAKIISGDIHVPQDIGPLTYIGTPHPVSFGDDYQPRMLWCKNDVFHSIPLTTLQRLTFTVKSFKDLKQQAELKKMKVGDQLKVKIQLDQKNLSQWSDIKSAVKEWCKYQQYGLFDITLEKELSTDTEIVMPLAYRSVDPLKALQQHLDQEKIDPYIAKIGIDLLNATIQQS